MIESHSKPVGAFLSRSIALLALISICICGTLLLKPMDTYAAGSGGSFIKVILKNGEKTTPCGTRADTVEEFLTVMGVELGEMDTVSPGLEEKLHDGDYVVVTRREYIEYVETEAVPYPTVYAHSPDVTAGEETISAEGVDGLAERVYAQVISNGVVVEQTLLEERVIVEPIAQQVSMGFRSIPVSQYDFEAKFDENGEPLNYISVLRNQRSAAYTANAGAKTSTGRPAAVGHVAVNPNVIPYGSKLFIQTNDGKFIYGYAIAADTGTSLMNGVIAIDFFYDTYAECVKHGIKMVDVFILE